MSILGDMGRFPTLRSSKTKVLGWPAFHQAPVTLLQRTLPFAAATYRLDRIRSATFRASTATDGWALRRPGARAG